MNTKIEWATKVWNPVTGCSKVSAGCANCYAEKIAKRFWGERKFTDVQCHPERLEEPLHWRKPQRIFVNSMSDLFHDDVLFDFIVDVFARMYFSKQHIFMILTKRPDRMKRFFDEWTSHNWPLPNVWLGVTAENQQTADERIPILLQIPAAVRFVSVEPMLGPVDLRRIEEKDCIYDALKGYVNGNGCIAKLDWVIAGPETGPGARPMEWDWIYNLVGQCDGAGVPFFDKKNILGLNLKQFPKGVAV